MMFRVKALNCKYELRMVIKNCDVPWNPPRSPNRYPQPRTRCPHILTDLGPFLFASRRPFCLAVAPSRSLKLLSDSEHQLYPLSLHGQGKPQSRPLYTYGTMCAKRNGKSGRKIDNMFLHANPSRLASQSEKPRQPTSQPSQASWLASQPASNKR